MNNLSSYCGLVDARKRGSDKDLPVVTSSFAFYIITFEPIEFQTRSAPQNDRLNLSFLKSKYLDGGKLARNGQKTTIYIS